MLSMDKALNYIRTQDYEKRMERREYNIKLIFRIIFEVLSWFK